VLDAEAQADIDKAIVRLGELNRTIWQLIADYGYPA
jgi:hypothetical protein